MIGTSVSLGIVHVLTGPDHLSALSTLAVGKSLKAAFGLGVRWGCGHSFGLLVVAIIFFALGQSLDLDGVGYWADMFVGIFMIFLGAWYMFKAFRERTLNPQDSQRVDDADLEKIEIQKIDQLADPEIDDTSTSSNDTGVASFTNNTDGKETANIESVDPSKSSLSVDPLFDDDSNSSTKSKWMTRIAAFVAGVFQGVAGPGGVLGVLVALKLNDWFLSSLYLALFFVASILTMGLYAVVYGFCTQRLTICTKNKRKCAFVLKFVSAVFSLIVGALWLSLSLTGTLDQLFH